MSSLIPVNIMRMLGGGPKMDNREVIISHLISEEGSVILSEKQKELLNRWDTADDLMRSLRYTSKEVANILSKKFDVSPATAWRYMEDARFVYGNTRKMNKQYLLALHIERMEAAIVLAERQGKKDVLPKLYEAYNKALAMMPDDKVQNNIPTAIVFNINHTHIDTMVSRPITSDSIHEITARKLASKGLDITDLIPEDDD